MYELGKNTAYMECERWVKAKKLPERATERLSLITNFKSKEAFY